MPSNTKLLKLLNTPRYIYIVYHSWTWVIYVNICRLFIENRSKFTFTLLSIPEIIRVGTFIRKYSVLLITSFRKIGSDIAHSSSQNLKKV